MRSELLTLGSLEWARHWRCRLVASRSQKVFREYMKLEMLEARTSAAMLEPKPSQCLHFIRGASKQDGTHK